jgi:hypothetical protein
VFWKVQVAPGAAACAITTRRATCNPRPDAAREPARRPLPGPGDARASLTSLGSGTIGGRDGQADLRGCLAREEAEGIAPAVVEEARLAVRAAITQRDVARLRAKGVLP